MKRPERIYLMPDFANLLAEQTDAQGFFRTYPFDGDIAYAPYSEARDAAVRELVELVRALIMESPGALSTRRFLALRDAVAAIEEAEQREGDES